jgi:acyl-CoA synthetase (AMP-forming)/AMP-acid ligase II
MSVFPDHPPTIPELLGRGLERFPDREILVLEDRRETFRSLERASSLVARGLLAAGVGKGSRVGILFPNGPDWAAAFFAAARIGAVSVPLNTYYKPRELLWVLRHADVDTLLLCSRFLGNDYLERLEQTLPALSDRRETKLLLADAPHLRRIFVWGECDRGWARTAKDLEQLARSSGIDAAFLREIEQTVTPSDWLVIVYTSGSTADPKAVVHTHANLVRHSHQMGHARGLRPDDRIWTPMPLFWMGGVSYGLLAALQFGACTVFEESFDAGRTLALLERERVTLSIGWPHYIKALKEHPDFATRDLRSMRSGETRDALRAPPRDPARHPNTLGMTETCGPHSGEDMSIELPEPLWGSFGLPLEGFEHKIVDPKTGASLPPGEPGEIYVRGHSLMVGLYKQERAETFDPDGFYPTGDGGYIQHGRLFFTGRLGEMIKTGGANVSPRELENLLAEFPEVIEAYVVGVPDSARGETVAAALLLRPGQQLTAEEVTARLKPKLSAFKLPRLIRFYSEEALPRTGSGKIDKPRLRALLAQQVREPDGDRT